MLNIKNCWGDYLLPGTEKQGCQPSRESPANLRGISGGNGLRETSGDSVEFRSEDILKIQDILARVNNAKFPVQVFNFISRCF